MISLNAQRFALSISLTTFCAIAVAQNGPTPTIPPSGGSTNAAAGNIVPGYLMSTPPKIDGVLEDAEWASVPTFNGLVDASNGGNVPYQGTFWLGYDSKYIYFAAKLPDDNPKAIKATQYRTNVSL